MKAFKLVLTGIGMLIALMLVATKTFTGTSRRLHPAQTPGRRDTTGAQKKEALMAFPLYTPVSMPY